MPSAPSVTMFAVLSSKLSLSRVGLSLYWFTEPGIPCGNKDSRRKSILFWRGFDKHTFFSSLLVQQTTFANSSPKKSLLLQCAQCIMGWPWSGFLVLLNQHLWTCAVFLLCMFCIYSSTHFVPQTRLSRSKRDIASTRRQTLVLDGGTFVFVFRLLK